MARKSKYNSIWDRATTNPESLLSMAHRYIEWMQVKNYTPRSVESYRYILLQFLQWCDERCITLINEVSTSILNQYLSYLHHLPNKRNSLQLALKTRLNYFKIVRCFFDWLARHDHLLYNPADKIRLLKCPKRLPQAVFTQQEIEQIINLADITKPLGIRDRTLMEVLYSCGIRVSELARLTVDSVALNDGLVSIEYGKGQKDRMIPLGARAGLWLSKYIHQVRSFQTDDLSERALFLGAHGKPLKPNTISLRISQYVKAANIGKSGSCHKFRHAMATLMLDNGADIRYIQEILGHAQLSTTEIYTNVSIHKLKQIHTLTHPGNRYEEI